MRVCVGQYKHICRTELIRAFVVPLQGRNTSGKGMRIRWYSPNPEVQTSSKPSAAVCLPSESCLSDSLIKNCNQEHRSTTDFQIQQKAPSRRIGAMEFLKAAPIRRLPRWQSALSRSKGWTCSSCRGHYAVASRRFATQPSPPATTTTPGKPYYVTTPIFYVNAGMD